MSLLYIYISSHAICIMQYAMDILKVNEGDILDFLEISVEISWMI